MLNFDCCYEISRYLKNSDHFNCCVAIGIKPKLKNFSKDFVLNIHNLLRLFDLGVNLAEIKTDFMDIDYNNNEIFDDYKQQLLVTFAREFKDHLCWFDISACPTLSTNFIREFKDFVKWEVVCSHQTLSEDLIRECKDYVAWQCVSKTQKFSNEFIREFKDCLEWTYITIGCRNIPIDFVREFKDYVDWRAISRSEVLSEDFIREFQDYVEWKYISKNQVLSEDFIREFKDSINWENISEYQRLSGKFMKEHKEYMHWSRRCPSITPNITKSMYINVYADYINLSRCRLVPTAQANCVMIYQ